MAFDRDNNWQKGKYFNAHQISVSPSGRKHSLMQQTSIFLHQNCCSKVYELHVVPDAMRPFAKALPEPSSSSRRDSIRRSRLDFYLQSAYNGFWPKFQIVSAFSSVSINTIFRRLTSRITYNCFDILKPHENTSLPRLTPCHLILKRL